MSRASINNFVGLFGRQAPIGLEVPEWVTIYVPSWTEDDDKKMQFLDSLVEGVAVIGALGCTVVFNVEATGWNRLGLEDVEEFLGKFVRGSRPYFRLIVSNLPGVRREGVRQVCAGRLMVLTFGEPPAMPEEFAGQEAIIIDHETTMVAKTRRPFDMATEVLEAVPEMAGVRQLPHWTESWSATLLDTTLGLLALNVLSKPKRFNANTFFFAADYLDETIAQAFNDRTLRARWRKKPKVEATATAQETPNNA